MKTADEIYQEMCSNYADLTGLTVRDGSDMAVRLYTAAAQLESLYLYNDWVKEQCFPQTATGEYLDYHAEMRGLTRRHAMSSHGFIKFSAQRAVDQEIVIPIGTTCITASGMRFITLLSGVIGVGERSCECPAKCLDVGEVGNVEANTVVYMSQPPVGVVSCVNDHAFVGGIEDEDDDSLRARILNHYITIPNGANVAYYEEQAKSVIGVAAVKVLPKNRGIGTVDIIVTGDEGIPDPDLVNAVYSTVSYSREICVDIDVYAPTPVTVDIYVKIDVEEGRSFNATNIMVARALQSYFDGTLLGKDVLLAKLGCIIFNVEGVKNYTILQPSHDVTVAEDELPVIGTLSIAEWE